MKLVIHAGAHKTATTSIQQWLKESVHLLREIGILYIEPNVLNRAGIIEDLHDASRSRRPKVTAKFLRLLSEKSTKSHLNTILLSHESILSFSNMLPRAIDKGFYAGLKNSAPCINMLAEEYELKLVFYIRRQDTFLASVYLEFIKRGNTYLDFKTYCQAVDYREISWLNLLERMSALMGNVEIVVRPFEIVENGNREFMREFLKAADIQGSEKLLESRFSKSNASVSEVALRLIQACGPHLEARDRRSLGQYLYTRFPVSVYGKAEVLSLAFSQEIVEFFKDENARVFEQWMPAYTNMVY